MNIIIYSLYNVRKDSKYDIFNHMRKNEHITISL